MPDTSRRTYVSAGLPAVCVNERWLRSVTIPARRLLDTTAALRIVPVSSVRSAAGDSVVTMTPIRTSVGRTRGGTPPPETGNAMSTATSAVRYLDTVSSQF